MGTHVKGMTKIVAIPATANATGTATINIGSLIPTGVVLKSADAAGSIAVQVSFDGTNFYTVESITTTNAYAYYPLAYAKYFGCSKIRLYTTTSTIVGTDGGTGEYCRLILSEV
jgi:hypothetical protein